jgi:hypothetical protein
MEVSQSADGNVSCMFRQRPHPDDHPVPHRACGCRSYLPGNADGPVMRCIGDNHQPRQEFKRAVCVHCGAQDCSSPCVKEAPVGKPQIMHILKREVTGIGVFYAVRDTWGQFSELANPRYNSYVWAVRFGWGAAVSVPGARWCMFGVVVSQCNHMLRCRVGGWRSAKS